MNPKKLLIVDDEPGIRESLQEYLEFEGYFIKVASCGEEALVSCDKNEFDLIISDIRMPHGDGKFLVQKLKEKSISSPPVLFMSGFTDLSLEEAYNLGARGILSKPFQPQELTVRIQHLLMEPSCTLNSNKPIIGIKIPAHNLELAVSEKRLNCGQNGFFISVDSLMLAVGDQVQIHFEDQSLHGEGIVRWIRAYEMHGKAKGFGCEFVKTTEPLAKAIENFVLENKVRSAIPINLKD